MIRTWRTSASTQKGESFSGAAPQCAASVSPAHRLDALDALPRRLQRGGRHRPRARQDVAQAHERRVGASHRLHQGFERVCEPLEPARVHDGGVGQREQPGAQRQQVAGEVAAVHRRDIERMQGLRAIACRTS